MQARNNHITRWSPKRPQMGDYLKSSLKYTARLNRMDREASGAAAALGGPGWAVRSTSELAGLLPPEPGAGGASSGAAASSLRFMRQQVSEAAGGRGPLAKGLVWVGCKRPCSGLWLWGVGEVWALRAAASTPAGCAAAAGV